MPSLPELLKALWQEGFFASPRTVLEVVGALTAGGHHYNVAVVRVALIRVAGASGFLTKTHLAGSLCYAQKHPINSPTGQRTALFDKYDLHPEIKRVAFKQFEDGYFKEAIQNALVEVIDQVKIKSRHPKNASGRELDGDDLMNHVFGCDNQTPKIKFNLLKTSLDKAEQRGFMNLFKGTVGIRDRKAHLNFIQNDPMKTIEYLSFASLLMRLLDEHVPSKKRR